MYVYMAKIISLSNEIYEKLSELKGEDSYSTVIKKLLLKKTNKEKILEFAGKGGINEKAIEEIKEGWKNWSKKHV